MITSETSVAFPGASATFRQCHARVPSLASDLASFRWHVDVWRLTVVLTPQHLIGDRMIGPPVSWPTNRLLPTDAWPDDGWSRPMATERPEHGFSGKVAANPLLTGFASACSCSTEQKTRRAAMARVVAGGCQATET